MPYIKPVDYGRALKTPSNPGELNYAMTMVACLYMRGDLSYNQFRDKIQNLVDEYIERLGVSYTNYNNAIGALECCGLELMRRVTGDYEDLADNCQEAMSWISTNLYFQHVAPYEDQKIAENGDVFSKEFVREEKG